jgi:hypothetical protein
MTLVDQLGDRFGSSPSSGWRSGLASRSSGSIRSLMGSMDPKIHAQLRREGIRTSPQAGGAADARGRPAGRVHAQAPALQHPPRPCRHPSTGPGQSPVHPRQHPTGCGSPIARGSRPGRALCGWPVSGMDARGGSWAGRHRTGPRSSWCWARWRMRCGAARSSASGWCSTATTARSPGSRGRRNTGLVTGV